MLNVVYARAAFMKLKIRCLLPLIFCCVLLVADAIEIQDGKRSIIRERALSDMEVTLVGKIQTSRLERLSEEDKEAQVEALRTLRTGFFSFADAVYQNDFFVRDVVSRLEVEKSGLVDSITRHPETFHHAVGFSGSRIGLEDGSWWTICSEDLSETRNWLTLANSLVPDFLTIVPNLDWPVDSSFHYLLINQQTGVSVKVNMTFSPVKHAPHTRHILSSSWLIDGSGYFYVQFLLNDGSVWNMLSSDFSITFLWHLDDIVIIGGNGEPSNILINVATNNYATGYCIKL